MSKPKKRELSKNKSCQSLGFLRPGLKLADLGDKEPSAPLGAGHKLLEGSLSDIALGGLSPRDFNDDVYERIMQEDYEKQPAIIYSLLDNATSIVKKYLTEYKNNKEGRKTLLNCFYLKCERVINCLALRLNDNSRLSEQDASVYLKEFTAFINRIKRWMDSILQKGIFDNLEYQQLRSIREGLIARLFVYEQKTDLASTKQNGNSEATPKTDMSLIYQADASTFYNIPKSVLSKAAQKQHGEPGYLWSGHTGKRVFYKKADIQKISRSRTKLKS